MTDSPEPPGAAGDPHYSPLLRTGLILTGTGTGGAYHAGVLRALQEAGVKIDIVGGNGVGVVGALFAAVDGAQRLWDEHGFWRAPAVRHLYPWRRLLSAAAGALAVSVAIVAVPLGAMVLGLAVYPVDFAAKLIGLTGADDWVGRYLRLTEDAFAPEGLPTWLPRLVVVVLGVFGLLAVCIAWFNAGGRRRRGPFWWRLVPAPLSSAEAATHSWHVMWDLVRGAAQLKQPSPAELSRRYIEMVSENLGQPGFRELVLAVHDLDARRDLVFALVAESRRPGLYRRSTVEEGEERRAEVFDLSGVAREYLAGAVAGALSLPVATEATPVRFLPETYWRGETHRLCDRPASVARVLEELMALGAEQVLIVSAASDTRSPHGLTPIRIDGRARLGEYLSSSEAAAVRDAMRLAARPAVRLFTIRPQHNPIGPFDFGGGFDDRSDRPQPLDELMAHGYEDAYHQFIEPVVGASGELLKVRSQKAKGKSEVRK